MIEDIFGSGQVEADDGGAGDAAPLDPGELADDIPLPGGVGYIFEGTRDRDVYVVGADDRESGILIPEDAPWVAGPFRNQNGVSQYLHASAPTTANLVLVSFRESPGFVSQPLRGPDNFGGGRPPERQPATHFVNDDSISTSTSWEAAVSLNLDNPRLLTEVIPQWRDVDGTGSAHNWALHCARDSRESPPGPDPANIGDGDGWLEVASGGSSTAIGSGGDGPDIRSDGYNVFTSALTLWLKADSGGSGGYAEIVASEGM